MGMPRSKVRSDSEFEASESADDGGDRMSTSSRERSSKASSRQPSKNGPYGSRSRSRSRDSALPSNTSRLRHRKLRSAAGEDLASESLDELNSSKQTSRPSASSTKHLPVHTGSASTTPKLGSTPAIIASRKPKAPKIQFPPLPQKSGFPATDLTQSSSPEYPEGGLLSGLSTVASNKNQTVGTSLKRSRKAAATSSSAATRSPVSTPLHTNTNKKANSSALSKSSRAGRPKAPPGQDKAPLPKEQLSFNNAPCEAFAHVTPHGPDDSDKPFARTPGGSRDVSPPVARVKTWAKAIQSQTPCDRCLRAFLEDSIEGDVPLLSKEIGCVVRAGVSCCDPCVLGNHSPCIIGDPLIIGSIQDIYFARNMLRSIEDSAKPKMPSSQAQRLSASWIRLASTAMSLSANGPSDAAAFKKTVRNPKYTSGGKEQEYIQVSDDAAIMQSVLFRQQALANMPRFEIVDFSAISHIDKISTRALRVILKERRYYPRVTAMDPGFSSWETSVRGFLEEVGVVVDEEYEECPEEYVLLLRELTHGMRSALPCNI